MGFLSSTQIDSFVKDGYIKIENAFSTEIAVECREILWKATKCDPYNATTWTQAVIRIGELGDAPFVEAANTTMLHNAYDSLVGKGNWIPKQSLGSFPIRFPSIESANDTGWHVDASFPGKDVTNYFEWRINIHSKARGLLMLFLFSDVSEYDAPTVIKVGSHIDVAKILAPKGEKGLSFLELASKLDKNSSLQVVTATGKAGTVYLCHPFIVHRAQDHMGDSPKFMAQPALMLKTDFNIYKPASLLCPVELAIKKGLE